MRARKGFVDTKAIKVTKGYMDQLRQRPLFNVSDLTDPLRHSIQQCQNIPSDSWRQEGFLPQESAARPSHETSVPNPVPLEALHHLKTDKVPLTFR